MDNQKYITKLQFVRDNSKDPSSFDALFYEVVRCVSPSSETYEKRINCIEAEFYKVRKIVRTKEINILNGLMEDIVSWLRDSGYRGLEKILTPQEHLIIGSTGCEKNDPYFPVGLSDEELSLDEVVKARHLQCKIIGTVCRYIPKEMIRGISLEELDDKGNTVRDPRPLDINHDFLTDYNKRENFPCQRD